MSATADFANQPAVRRTTIGQCGPYNHCQECGKPDDQCPNMVMPQEFCACGRPLTQSDFWQTREDGVRVCRYCRPAAPYIRDLLAEISADLEPVKLTALWAASPWRPELTDLIALHLRAAGVKLAE